MATATDIRWKKIRWKTSSYSGQNGGDCVEIGYDEDDPDGDVYVRDSKDPAGGVLVMSRQTFEGFAASAARFRRY